MSMHAPLPFCMRHRPHAFATTPTPLLCLRCVTMNQVRGIFGFTQEDNIGKIAFPAVQASCVLLVGQKGMGLFGWERDGLFQ